MVTNKTVRRRKSGSRLTTGDRVFDFVNVVFMCVFMFVMFYPLYYTTIASVSDITQVGLGEVHLFPKGFTLEAYRQVFNHKQIWVGYRNSLLYTSLNVCYNIIIMFPVAYTLSKKNLFGRGTLTFYFVLAEGV